MRGEKSWEDYLGSWCGLGQEQARGQSLVRGNGQEGGAASRSFAGQEGNLCGQSRGQGRNGRGEDQRGSYPRGGHQAQEGDKASAAQPNLRAGELSWWHSGKFPSKTGGLSQLRRPSYSQPKAGRDRARLSDSGARTQPTLATTDQSHQPASWAPLFKQGLAQGPPDYQASLTLYSLPPTNEGISEYFQFRAPNKSHQNLRKQVPFAHGLDLY